MSKDWVEELLNASKESRPSKDASEWEAYGQGERRMVLFSEKYWTPTTVADHYVSEFRGFNAPTVSGRYIPNKPNFEALSSSIALDLPMYVFGPTGCGKTLAFEYFAATTGRPLLRILHDSSLDKAKVFGQTGIINEDGVPVTRFKPGQFVRSASEPTLVLLDEVDKGETHVLPMYFSALDRRQILLPEMEEANEGAITPCDEWRIVATGNTRGAGDETGLYMSCNAQDAAFLNRFDVFLEEDYLTPDLEDLLVKSLSTRLVPADRKRLVQFSDKVHTAFKSGTVLSAFSPRNLSAICKIYDSNGNMQDAIRKNYMNRLGRSEYDVVQSILNSVFGF